MDVRFRIPLLDSHYGIAVRGNFNATYCDSEETVSGSQTSQEADVQQINVFVVCREPYHSPLAEFEIFFTPLQSKLEVACSTRKVINPTIFNTLHAAKRETFGEFHHLFLDLKEDESRLKLYFRMDRNASQKDTEMWQDNQEKRLEQAEGAIHRGLPLQYGMWIREKLVTYFNGSGALSWQDNYL
ncbi:hypothetical protein PoB_004491700 [Plakobranchus ocellatus]|uniref:Uncharacterized protein n=1 Tax=Plakobranchus ocellatus TaxID=259542 RepID=A0AAV4BG98_9GAST|nr:hypothetical protein PoB_004491700 [Plakobranchus ocellatus]